MRGNSAVTLAQLKEHVPTIDAWLFAFLVGGYAIFAALHFTDTLASLVVLLLALCAIGLYLSRVNYRRRLYLVYTAIAAIAVMLIILGIYLRYSTAPYKYVHDGAIQTEEAVKFLLAGKNPYAENYLNTPMALWHFEEPNVSINPALYHLAYLPFSVVFSVPFYVVSQTMIGWFDERMISLLLFVATLMLVPRLTRDRQRQLALLLVVGLNPLFVPFFAEGRNDIFVLFWVLLSIVLLQADRRVLSCIALACACGMKETAWFVVPFYAIFFLAKLLPLRRRDLVGQIVIPFSVFAVVFAGILLPFFFWNPAAFVDDVFSYIAGTTEFSYPIKSLGFGGIALAYGWIRSNTEIFPFSLLQLVFGLPTLIFLGGFQFADNTIKRLWISYGVLTLVIAFFSRVFNDNHLGYIISLFAIGFLSENIASSSGETSYRTNAASMLKLNSDVR